jgi:hypothetical protein
MLALITAVVLTRQPEETTVVGPEQEQPSLDPDERLLFGLGPTADTALESPLVDQAPVRMLTTWFNRPEDLDWLRGWRDALIPRTYAQGYAHHVIVFNEGESGTTETPYGRACGLLYPLSEGFVDDMRELAEIFHGNGPLYVTMFSEFQTYPCEDNQWVGSESYYRALKDRYMATLEIFHEGNPEARVALGWGGWQGRWDDPSVGGGRSLITHFADVLARSDYQAFQAMQVDSNVDDVRTMTELLSPFGPVMVAHYLPDDESTVVWDTDVRQIFTDPFVREATQDGLFAFAFMDPALLDADDERMQDTIETVERYAADWVVPGSLDASEDVALPG